jgi:hypothetical protein
MQRWQRRAHLWLWFLVAAVVATTLAALIKDQPALGTAPSDTQQPSR